MRLALPYSRSCSRWCTAAHTRPRQSCASLRTAAGSNSLSGSSDSPAAFSTSGSQHMAETFSFGPHTIQPSEVFVTTPLSFAFVNLKPLVPGHVLVGPRRVVPRFTQLTPQEVSDLWCLAQRVGAALEGHYSAAALTLAIQDGAAAGQSVPHVHVHVLPRKAGDFPRNDDVYDALHDHGTSLNELHHAASGPTPPAAAAAAQRLDLDVERRPRTPQEMAAEAAQLRGLFSS